MNSKIILKYDYESLETIGFLENEMGPQYLSNSDGIQIDSNAIGTTTPFS